MYAGWKVYRNNVSIKLSNPHYNSYYLFTYFFPWFKVVVLHHLMNYAGSLGALPWLVLMSVFLILKSNSLRETTTNKL